MKCPIDATDLNMTDRQGIEIDYCPKCRGVWLDRGELDKIIERSAVNPTTNMERTATADHRSFQTPQPDYRETDKRHDDGRYGKKRKRENFLGDLFDF